MTSAVLALREQIEAIGPVVIAYSGGVDSTYLAAVAAEVLGAENALCVTASSASMSATEAAEAATLALELGLRHELVETNELSDPRYVANAADRCAWCKTHLMDAVAPRALELGATVLLGVNLDDLGEHRPGQAVALERGARFPLVEAGLTKAMVREASAAMGLRTADKPATPCLASRLPYGTPVTLGALKSVEAAEAAIRALGFPELRVRHHGTLALVEVPEARLAEALSARGAIVEAARSAGYAFCALDLEGLSSGRLNRVLG